MPTPKISHPVKLALLSGTVAAINEHCKDLKLNYYYGYSYVVGRKCGYYICENESKRVLQTEQAESYKDLLSKLAAISNTLLFIKLFK